jgi:hypothetical protein
MQVLMTSSKLTEKKRRSYIQTSIAALVNQHGVRGSVLRSECQLMCRTAALESAMWPKAQATRALRLLHSAILPLTRILWFDAHR